MLNLLSNEGWKIAVYSSHRGEAGRKRKSEIQQFYADSTSLKFLCFDNHEHLVVKVNDGMIHILYAQKCQKIMSNVSSVSSRGQQLFPHHLH